MLEDTCGLTDGIDDPSASQSTLEPTDHTACEAQAIEITQRQPYVHLRQRGSSGPDGERCGTSTSQPGTRCMYKTPNRPDKR